MILLVSVPINLGFKWAIRQGLIKGKRGAGEAALEAMTIVEYQPHMFANTNDDQDDRPQAECLFCLETFSSEKRIVVTPCSHYMHHSCLAKWLKTSHVCPLCRTDLAPQEDFGDERAHHA